MPRIVLYIQPGFQVPGRDRCFSGTPFAIKTARLLRYKRLDFEVDEIGWAVRGKRLPELSASGKLPVLQYDGEYVEDSTEMAYFLEAKHPVPSVIPSDPLLRARCHFIEEWSDEVLHWYGSYEQRRMTASDAVDQAYFPDLPESVRAQAAELLRESVEQCLSHQGFGRYPVEKIKGDIRRGLDAVTAFVEADGFVAGQNLSIADLALIGQFDRRMSGTNPWMESEILSRAPVVDWLARVDALSRL